MTMTSAGALARAFAADGPPNPPPTMTILGRTPDEAKGDMPGSIKGLARAPRRRRESLLKNISSAYGRSHPEPKKRPVSVLHAAVRHLGALMDHTVSHNAFNVLFILSFFATFAVMMVRFA